MIYINLFNLAYTKYLLFKLTQFHRRFHFIVQYNCLRQTQKTLEDAMLMFRLGQRVFESSSRRSIARAARAHKTDCSSTVNHTAEARRTRHVACAANVISKYALRTFSPTPFTTSGTARSRGTLCSFHFQLQLRLLPTRVLWRVAVFVSRVTRIRQPAMPIKYPPLLSLPLN